MIGQSLVDAFGKDLSKSFGSLPGSTGGQILADITKDRKVKSVAITYTNNDYGKGLADVYKAAAS